MRPEHFNKVQLNSFDTRQRDPTLILSSEQSANCQQLHTARDNMQITIRIHIMQLFFVVLLESQKKNIIVVLCFHCQGLRLRCDV